MTKDEILAQAAKAKQAADREIERLKNELGKQIHARETANNRITTLKGIIADQAKEIAHLKGYLTALYDLKESAVEPPEQPRLPQQPVCRPLQEYGVSINNVADETFRRYVNGDSQDERPRAKEWYE